MSDDTKSPHRPGTLGRDPAPGLGPEGRLAEDFRIEAPAVSLPKGGGAISGMGEKVSANPVTGSANVSLPVPLTPGRGGFTPSLSLSYDSGGANGLFGLGWRLNVPSIRRKTDKGLPEYIDSLDTFVMSDAEDLVPFLKLEGGSWVRETRDALEGGVTYAVTRYRPRVESAFSLIEHWRAPDRRVHWRTRSRDNTLRIYGRSDDARLVDPENTTRVFEWLLEEERDERGNVISYVYAAEDRTNIGNASAEFDRQVAYRYPKRVSYANTVMDDNPDRGGSGAFRLHVVFDYGEHDPDDPGNPRPADDPGDPGLTPSTTWPARLDPFSRFRARFDVRCYRLCRRVLLFHEFASVRDDGAGQAVPALVRSLTLTYDERKTLSVLTQAVLRGHTWNGTGYDSAALPAVTYTYQEPQVDETVRYALGLDELPSGLDLGSWQFVDLDGEGLTGLLTEQAGAWWYKRNEGEGRFAAMRRLDSQPSVGLGQGARLVDLDGDGNLDVVVMSPTLSGYFARTPEQRWAPFQSFRQVPTHDSADPDARLVDLDGDGHADLLVTEGESLLVYPSRARQGYGEPVRIPMPRDEEKGPRFVLSTDDGAIHFADLTGDGLSDVVRVRNGSIGYWPNLGYGRFGRLVVMAKAPRFDHPDRYDPARLRFADLDGSGPTDLVYLGPDRVRLFFNEAGNSWSEETALDGVPLDRPGDVQVSDLLGDGTACLVWTGAFRGGHRAPAALQYVRLMAQGKPWLMTTVANGLGRTVAMTYTPSTAYYLADRRAGRPWATRLPFPVHCLSRLESTDAVSGWRFVNRYAYHHGFFDGEEREFRGFGMVEQWDTETFGDGDTPGEGGLTVALPPVRTRTWFHTGAWTQEQTLSAAYRTEYADLDPDAHHLDEPTVEGGLPPAELREAHRALKGRMVRQEVYAEDANGDLDVLYTVTEQTYAVSRLQPSRPAPSGEPPRHGQFGVFRVDDRETLSYAYDANLAASAPDPRVSHTLVLEVDAYGVATKTAAVSYPRRGTGHDPEQTALTVVVNETGVLHQDDRVAVDDVWHIGVPLSSRSWALTGTAAFTDDQLPADPDSVKAAFDAASPWAFELAPTGPGPHRRLLAHQRTRYWDDVVTAALPFGTLGKRALPHHREALAVTSGLVTEVFGTDLSAISRTEDGYVDVDAEGDGTPDGDFWVASGTTTLDDAAFYVPTEHRDAFGNLTTITYDADALAVQTVLDPAQLLVTVVTDYRTLQPVKLTDPSGTETEAAFDPLGRVVGTSVRNGSDGDATGVFSAAFTYDTTTLPASVHAMMREEHGGTDWQETWAYSDGGGNAVQTKAQAAPGDAQVVESGVLSTVSSDPRFIGTGRTIVDNKGNVVKQYEPFFSTTSAYEDEDELVMWGQASVFDYDPVGRNTKETLPDDHVRTWSYGPWRVEVRDEEDNLTGGAHENTPTTTDLDSLGRVYQSTVTPDGTAQHVTKLVLDVQGNVEQVVDARSNVIQVQRFDLLGRPLFTGAADEGYDATASPANGKGETRAWPAVDGQVVKTWRSGDLTLHRSYDALRRPVALTVDEGSGARLVELTLYGDALSGVPAADFAGGRPWQTYDAAGRVAFAYDFRGRTVSETRQVLDDITVDADWTGLETQTTVSQVDTWVTANGGLDSEAFAVTTVHDALDRVTEQTAPDASRTVYGYDAGGRLFTVDVHIHGAGTATAFVTSVTYNARGQREQIAYGNHTTTTTTYDPQRFWLDTLVTQRLASSSHGSAKLQDLSYGRDAVGNIVAITDAAHDTLYYNNTAISTDRAFVYDDLYRLVEATGREKESQAQTTAHFADYAGATSPFPATGVTTPLMRRYTQTYTYDPAGNILEMAHTWGSGGWTRGYAYEAGNTQLLSTSRPGDTPSNPATHSDAYAYNDRGAMVFLPHLNSAVSANLVRDFRDQLRSADLSSTATAWYAYDAGGKRVRKQWIKNSGALVEERIYIGPYEVWRQRDSSGALQEERQTLHVMDDERRIAMVETQTQGAQATNVPRLRYQLDDHLGTATVEVDHDGGLITYEEYHPYGSVAWKAEKANLEVCAKRYRYTGMERDDETGLQLHGVRYYAPWLGRWVRCDPIGLKMGRTASATRETYPSSSEIRRGPLPLMKSPNHEFRRAGFLTR